MTTSQEVNKEESHAQDGNGEARKLRVISYEHIHPVRDNGYNYDIIEKRYKVVADDNNETIFDNNGQGFMSEHEALQYIFDQSVEDNDEQDIMKPEEVEKIDYQKVEIPDDYDMEKLKNDTEKFNKYSMSMSPIEYYRYEQFAKNHRHKDVNKGAIGGHISIDTVFTSIGCGRSVRCSICDEDADITDYNW